MIPPILANLNMFGGVVAPPPVITAVGPVNYMVSLEIAEDGFVNVSQDVTDVSINYQLGWMLAGITPAECDIRMTNPDGRYSPENLISPYAGRMKPNRRIEITGVQSATTYTLFRGFVDEWGVELDGPQFSFANVKCRDQLRFLRGRTITTSLFINQDAATIFTHVMSATSIQSYNVDPIPDVFSFAWWREAQADQAIGDLINAGFYWAYTNPDGIFRIRDRYWDQKQTPTIAASYTDFFSLTYTREDDKVINEALIESVPRERSTEQNTLSFISLPVFIPRDSGVALVFEYLDPVTRQAVPAVNLTPPEPTVDYATFLNEDGSGTATTDTTSVSTIFYGETAVASITNVSSFDVYLTKFQIRGYSVLEKTKVAVRTKDDASQNFYGRKDFTLTSNLFANVDYVTNFGAFIVDRQQEPITQLDATLRNEYPDNLLRKLGDIVHVQNSLLAINDDYIIHGVSHRIHMGEGQIHEMEMHLEAYRDQNLFVVGSDQLTDTEAVLGF